MEELGLAIFEYEKFEYKTFEYEELNTLQLIYVLYGAELSV